MESYVWLVVAAVMALVEVVSFGLITVWFVVGALAAFAAAWLGFGLVVQLAVFLVVSLGCLIGLRPVFVKYRDRGKAAEPTLVGQTAIVCEPIDSVTLTGRVRTSDNMTWLAKSATGQPIALGAPVVVVAEESIKLIVEPALPQSN